jgi:hypothetical protein
MQSYYCTTCTLRSSDVSTTIHHFNLSCWVNRNNEILATVLLRWGYILKDLEKLWFTVPIKMTSSGDINCLQMASRSPRGSLIYFETRNAAVRHKVFLREFRKLVCGNASLLNGAEWRVILDGLYIRDHNRSSSMMKVVFLELSDRMK